MASSMRTGGVPPAPSPRGGIGAEALAGRASSATVAASTRLMTPAVRNVPGRPAQAIRMKPLARTPAAAPRLFAKYSMATASPGAPRPSFMLARTSPALISGKVAPSRTDCGRINALASASFAASAGQPAPRAGSMAAYDQSVAPTKISWNTRAQTPMTASTAA